MTNRLMTTSEVADYLAVPVTTLYRWRGTGEGPRALRIGKHLRFRVEDLNTWLDCRADDDRADIAGL
jgi:excisionase family DNA binding protein